MKKINFLCMLFGILLMSSCLDVQREIKNTAIDMYGAERTIVFMDCTGDTIRQWRGRYLITSDSANGFYFDDENGKRISIHGGIVITEEL